VGAQCKSNYCDRADDQVCGACADKGGIAASCDQNADCAGGLTCQTNVDTLAKTCQTAPPAVVRAKISEPCGGMLPACDSGLVCVGTGMMRACAAVVATEGAPCDPARRMLADCDANLFLGCNRTTMLCEKRKLVDVGQPCNELPDGSNATCKGGANCVRLPWPGSVPVTGTCTADVGVGQPCAAAAADGPGCQPSLRCVLDAPGAAHGQVPAPGRHDVRQARQRRRRARLARYRPMHVQTVSAPAALHTQPLMPPSPPPRQIAPDIVHGAPVRAFAGHAMMPPSGMVGQTQVPAGQAQPPLGIAGVPAVHTDPIAHGLP
jgi:hypothetical protein